MLHGRKQVDEKLQTKIMDSIDVKSTKQTSRFSQVVSSGKGHYTSLGKLKFVEILEICHNKPIISRVKAELEARPSYN